jgi:uncharacterized protein
MPELSSDSDLRRVLTNAHTIAVLGAHVDPGRPAGYVPAYLQAHGYRVLAVNAMYAGQALFGEQARATLAELAEPVDIVDIFRRADKLGEHLADILAMQPRPKWVWLQLGVRNDAFASELLAAGDRKSVV